MFDGLVIKGGESAELDAEHGEVFHLSQACLNDPRDGGKTYVKIVEGERSMVICCLQKDKCEHAPLDIFIHPSQASFKVEGKNEVHLVGYWEPQGDSDDEGGDLNLMGDEAEESEGEDDESELEDEVPALLNGGDHIKKPEAMLSLAKAGEDESDEEDNEEEESDEEDEMPSAAPKAGKGLAAGASANKQKPQQSKKIEAAPATKGPQVAAGKAKAAPKAGPQVAANEAGQKRKQAPTDKASTQPPSKQAKTAAAPAGKASTEGGDDKFESDLTEYLKKHGRTSMSELGSKVKKPAGVSKKLAAFLKDKPTMFKVDGSHVELLK